MTWDYALASHNMKLAGGPEAYVNAIESAALLKGRLQGAGACALLAGATYGIVRLVRREFIRRKADADDAKARVCSAFGTPDTSSDNGGVAQGSAA